MLDAAQKYQKIIEFVSRFENGNVSDSMKRLGLNYKVNFGVSIPVLDKIAEEYLADSNLATYLWKKDERECKLLSLRIFDFKNTPEDYSAMVIEGIENSELAEQAAWHFFIKMNKPFDFSVVLIKSKNQYCQLAGMILISKIAQNYKDMKDEIFIDFINILGCLKIDNTIHQKRGLSRALLQIGLRNENLKAAVIQFINYQFIENKDYKEWLEQEVNYYLLIKN